MDDLIEIMQNYGAYNAANLDGGTSTAMSVNYELINDPIDRKFSEKNIDRKFLLQNAVKDFDKIQEIFLSKRDIIDETYSNVVEKIILASAKEALQERNLENGVVSA